MTTPPRAELIAQTVKAWREEGILTEHEIQRRADALAGDDRGGGIPISSLAGRRASASWRMKIREEQAASHPGVESSERAIGKQRRRYTGSRT